MLFLVHNYALYIYCVCVHVMMCSPLVRTLKMHIFILCQLPSIVKYQYYISCQSQDNSCLLSAQDPSKCIGTYIYNKLLYLKCLCILYTFSVKTKTLESGRVNSYIDNVWPALIAMRLVP